MSSELERRLEGCLAEAPEPDPGAGEKALHRALRALQPVAAPRRGIRTAVLVFAAVGRPARDRRRLARCRRSAARQLRREGEAAARPRPSSCCPRERTASPRSSTVGCPSSHAAASGYRCRRAPRPSRRTRSTLPLESATRSSRMAPNGRRAWPHPAGGKVVAIAWAPDGFRIAYVVHARPALRAADVIYGNGAHDTVLDRSVRPVRPSWRADSRAFAYVGAGGKAILYDFAHQKHSVVATLTPVTRVVFPPVGKTLVVATPSQVRLGRKTVAGGQVEALGWFGGLPAAALADRNGASIRSFGHMGRRVDNFFVPGRVVGLTGGLVVTRAGDRILAGWREKTVKRLLTLGRTRVVEDLQVG